MLFIHKQTFSPKVSTGLMRVWSACSVAQIRIKVFCDTFRSHSVALPASVHADVLSDFPSERMMMMSMELVMKGTTEVKQWSRFFFVVFCHFTLPSVCVSVRLPPLLLPSFLPSKNKDKERKDVLVQCQVNQRKDENLPSKIQGGISLQSQCQAKEKTCL